LGWLGVAVSAGKSSYIFAACWISFFRSSHNSNALFNENLYISYLLHPEMRNYVEIGYGISLLKLMDIGAYIGFSEKGYRSWGFRFSMDLKSITEVVL
jgi:hypothetical protein